MEKLKTNELSLGLNQTFRNDLVDNFEKIQNGVDGQSDSLNKQITDLLGDVAPQDKNEVTQARIDVHGNPYGTLKSRADATQTTAETALSEERDTSVEVQDARTNSNSKTYPTLKERLDNQENDLNNNINSKLSQISAVPETFANLSALQAAYPNGKTGLFVTADTGHKYIWSNNSWTDSGVYQAVGIADHSIVQSMIKQPLTRGVVLMGSVTIDESSKTVSCDNDVGIAINGRYVYVSVAQSVPIPDGGSPLYVYVHETDATLHCDRNQPNADPTTTNDDIYIAVVYTGRLHLYGTGSETFVSYKQGINDGVPDHANLAYGQIVFDPYAKTLSSTGLLIFETENAEYTINDPFTLALSRDIQRFTTHVFFDTISNKLIELTTGIVLDSYVHIATIYQSGIYGADTRNWVFKNAPSSNPHDREPNTAFIIFNNKIPATLSSVYTGNGVTTGHLHMDAGACLISQYDGNFYNIPNSVDIDYSYNQSDVTAHGLYTLFFDFINSTVYFDYYKHNSHDIKILSIYDGKVYGIDSKTISINGSLQGGFDNASLSGNYSSLKEWQRKAIDGAKTNIAWLGDSTWQGYEVVNQNNIFPTYINTLLPKAFPNVLSFDCSKGGLTTKELYDNFDSLMSQANNVGVLFIGGGLNDGSSLSESKQYLIQLIEKSKVCGYIPVIATTQATAVPLSETEQGGYWDGMKQQNFVLTNNMRRDVAKQLNVPLLDFEKATHDFIELSTTKMSDMFVDYLHGMDSIHIFEANFAMSFLDPFAENVDKNTLIGITNMYIDSDVSCNIANSPLDPPYQGFKVAFKFPSSTDQIILSYRFYVGVKNTYQLKAFNSGVPVNVTLDGTTSNITSDATIGNMNVGYHTLTVKATQGNTNFYGLKLEKTND